MKYFLYGLAAFVVLLVAAAQIGPRFVDWNAHKPRLAAEVRAATGRDLSIDGDMHLAILPAPALSADQVRFANISGGTEPFMAEVRELRIRIALLPLIRGRIQVESVSLVGPKILLEKLADGRRNWALGGTAKADEPDDPAADPSGGGLPGQIELNSFTISDGTLIYRDAADGREERIEQLDAEIVAESLSGPMTSRGSAILQGIETEFDLAAGRLIKSGATPFNVTLRLPDADAEAQFAGSVSLHPDTLRFRGHLKGQGSNLAAGLRALSGGALAGSGLTAQPFVLHSDLSGDLATVTGSEVRLRLGEAAMSGDATINLEPTLDATLSLSATRIDLDQLLAFGGSDQIAPPAAPARADGPNPAGKDAKRPISLPSDIKARLELAVEGLIYRGQAMRQLRFDASLQDGKITIGQAMTLLPGGSDLSLTGVVSPGDSGLQFAGRVESVSDNFRGLASWLGADLAAVPADRLRRMSFAGQIEASRRKVELKSIDLRVDLSRITGGIVAAMRQRVGFGVGLAMDKLNLDAYLPASVRAGGEAPDTVTETAGSAVAESPAGPGLRALLDRFDANLDFRIGSLTYRGAAAKDLRLDGTLQNGAMTVRQASIGALPGARAAYSGDIRDLATRPRFDGELEVEVADPRRLAKAFQLGAGSLTRLGSFTLRSGLKGSGDDLEIESALTVLGGRLGLTGSLRPTAEPFEFDLAVAAQHPDLPGLVVALGGASGLKPDFGGLDLTGQIVGTPLDFSVSDLAGELGSVELSGELGLDLTGPKPLVRANLTAGDLPLAALLAPVAAPKQDGGGSRARGRGAEDTRWSSEALDLAYWRAFDAELGLAARRIALERADLENVKLTAELRDGVLDVERLTASLHGGALQVIGKVVAKESLEAGFAVTALEVDLGKLLREQAGFEHLSGPVNLNAELTTSGSSEAELVAALGGQGEFTGTLQVKVEDEAHLGDLTLDLLGDKVRGVRNVSDAMTMLLDSFAGAPAGLAGSFTLDKGVLTTDDTRIEGPAAYASTHAEADLPAWQIDSQTDVFQAPHPDTPYLTANLKGPLDAPDVRIGGLPFKNPDSEPAGGLDQQPDGEPAPVLPKKLKTQDVLKGLLKGLPG